MSESFSLLFFFSPQFSRFFFVRILLSGRLHELAIDRYPAPKLGALFSFSILIIKALCIPTSFPPDSQNVERHDEYQVIVP